MSRVWLRMRGHIGSHEIFAIAQPDHHGRAVARRHNFVRIAPAQDSQRKNAAQLLHRDAHGLFQIAFEVLLHQMRDDFRVGFGLESMPFALQLPSFSGR